MLKQSGTDDHKQIIQTITDCEQRRLRLLDATKPFSSTEVKRMQAIKTALKLIINKAAIDEHVKRLHLLRDQVSFHILVSLKAQLDHGKEHTDKALELMRDDAATMICLLERNTLQSDIASSATQAAIARCVNLSSRGRETLQSPHDLYDYHGNETSRVKARSRVILSKLAFQKMRDRFDAVDENYPSTYSWIFAEATNDLAWDDFATFLTYEGVLKPYWINGKAGSGKSTLMRYILEHPNTRKHLLEWAGTEEGLLTAKYFAWSLGSELQKTPLGLLRSILHELLKQKPDLIRSVLPDMWYATDEGASDLDELSYAEAKKAFLRLVNLPWQSFRICLFIDGIDEFDEDHVDVATFVKSLVSTTVKVIVTSRPIPTCAETYDDSPSLRLQDLTHSDIATYVNGQLGANSIMAGTILQHAADAKALIHEITDKADGVFLWVILVTHSLLSGLRNGDSIDELRSRLRIIPKELGNLFKMMLGKLEPLYQQQASDMFQLTRLSMEVLNEQPFKAVFMAFIDDSPDHCLAAGVHDLSAIPMRNKIRVLQRRLRSRCCGLVEIKYSSDPIPVHLHNQDQLTGKDRVLLAGNIQYLHRTVVEYLHQPENWSQSCLPTPSSEAAQTRSISHAALSMIKHAVPQDRHDTQEHVWDWLDVLVRCERKFQLVHATSSDMQRHIRILDEANKIVQQLMCEKHSSAPIVFRDIHQLWNFTPEERADFSYLKTIQGLYACAGLHRYIDTKLAATRLFPLTSKNPHILFQSVFLELRGRWGCPLEDRLNTAEVLIRHGADPNQEKGSWTFWGQLLLEFWRTRGSSLIFTSLCKACILRYADPQKSVRIVPFSFQINFRAGGWARGFGVEASALWLIRTVYGLRTCIPILLEYLPEEGDYWGSETEGDRIRASGEELSRLLVQRGALEVCKVLAPTSDSD